MKVLLKFATLIALGLLACNQQTDLQSWIKKVGPLKEKCLQNIQTTPYSSEINQIFKSYFSEIEQVALNLVRDPKQVKVFNQALANVQFSDLCQRVFLEKKNWQLIQANCIKNGFYVCSEEVRAYPVFISAIRSHLDSNQVKRFDSTPECARAL